MTNTNTSAGTDQLRGWVGRTLVDPAGDKIGHIDDIYMDAATGRPEWLAVTTGWFGRRVSFVPIAGASARGDDVASRWDKPRIKDAPHAEPDGELSPQEESDLYRHYGLQPAAAGTPPTAGRPGSAPAPDAAAALEGDLVRSEEELQIGKEQHETGRVRLRKWVETEHVTRTVPVSHEEAHLERETISGDEAAAAMGDADLTESDREVVLNEEQIVVNKRVVPKERVRIEKETVTEDVPVEADLRRERVEVDGMDDTPS